MRSPTTKAINFHLSGRDSSLPSFSHTDHGNICWPAATSLRVAAHTPSARHAKSFEELPRVRAQSHATQRNVAWRWRGLVRKTRVERTRLIPFRWCCSSQSQYTQFFFFSLVLRVACGVVAANRSADIRRYGLTKWRIARSSPIQKWPDESQDFSSISSCKKHSMSTTHPYSLVTGPLQPTIRR